MQLISSSTPQSVSVNFSKADSLRDFTSSQTVDVVSGNSKRYLRSDQVDSGRIVLRIDAAIESGKVNGGMSNNCRQVDWMNVNLNLVSPEQNFAASLKPRLHGESNELDFTSCNWDISGDRFSPVHVQLGIVSWHVRRRSFVETSKAAPGKIPIFNLNAFDSDGDIEAVASESQHHLNVAMHAECGPGLTAVPGLSHLDLVTWYVRRRYLIESGKTSSRKIPSELFGDRLAAEDVDWSAIPIEMCSKVVEGSSTVSLLSEPGPEDVRGNQFVKVAQNDADDTPVGNSLVDNVGDHCLEAVCNLEIESQDFKLQTVLAGNELTSTLRYSMPVSLTYSSREESTGVVGKKSNILLRNAKQGHVALNEKLDACSTVRPIMAARSADGVESMLHARAWSTCDSELQGHPHENVSANADIAFAMLSPPSRCAVQFATCSYLRGSSGYPSDWAIPAIESLGCYVESVVSLGSNLSTELASVASAILRDEFLHRIASDECRQGMGRTGVTLSDSCEVLSTLSTNPAQHNENSHVNELMHSQTANEQQQSFGWHDLPIAMRVAESPHDMSTCQQFDEAIYRAVSRQQIAEDHFPPLATFELPQVIMSGTVCDEELLDSKLIVMLGGQDGNLDSAEIACEGTEQTAHRPALQGRSEMVHDSDLGYIRGECVTKYALRQVKVARDSELLGTSLAIYLDASWSLFESWGGGSMLLTIGTRVFVLTDKRSLCQLEDLVEAVLVNEQVVLSNLQKEPAAWDGLSGDILVTRCNLQTQAPAGVSVAKMHDPMYRKKRMPRTAQWNVAVIADAQQSIHLGEANGIQTCSAMQGVWAA